MTWTEGVEDGFMNNDGSYGPQAASSSVDVVQKAVEIVAKWPERIFELETALERAQQLRTCLLSGPGRGDCEHFVGWPEIEDESTTDVWGVPFGWCIVCYWRHQALVAQSALERAQQEIGELQEQLAEWETADVAMLRGLIESHMDTARGEWQCQQEIETWHKIWNDIDLLTGRVEAMRTGTADLGERMPFGFEAEVHAIALDALEEAGHAE